MHTELVVSIADLRYISIQCQHCHTKVILDMREKSDFAAQQGIFAPKTCPGCHTPYDSAIQPNVDNLQRAYKSLLGIADCISFRSELIKEEQS